MTSLPETVFAEVMCDHEPLLEVTACTCGEEVPHDSPTEDDFYAWHRAHIATELAACLVLVGVEHTEGGQLYRVGRCPDDSPVYAIRDKETP